MKYLFILAFLCVSVGAFAQHEDDTIYNITDVSKAPQYPGGTTAFYRFISQNFSVDRLGNRQGRIVVQFVVEKDSTVSNITVLKSIGGNSGREAVRAVKKAGKWIPGEIDGQYVRTRQEVPIQVRKN